MKSFVFALFALAVVRFAAAAVKCDETHECHTGQTCCKLASGRWGCCPLPQAVCCQDHVHCCPEGTTCDVSSGKCNRGLISLPWMEKQPAIVKADESLYWSSEKEKAVKCDETHECHTGQTCCKLASGRWGCCPLPQAVCCQDHVHCCPEGTTCDVSSGKCNRGHLSLPWMEKQPAIVRP